MIRHLKYDYDFYMILTGFTAVSLSIFSSISSLSFNGVMTLIFATVLAISCCALSEALLATEMRQALRRKLLLLITLFFTSSVPFMTEGIIQILVITLLSGWLFSTREFFYLDRGNLFFCAGCGLGLCFMAPIMTPFLFLQCLLFFKIDRENAYILFSSFTLPGLFWIIYKLKLNVMLTSSTFENINELVSQSNLGTALLKSLEHMLSLTFQPTLFIGFMIVLACLALKLQDPHREKNLWLFDLIVSLALFFPIFMLVSEPLPISNHNYLNYIISFPLLLILFPNIVKFWNSKSANASIKIGLIILALVGIYPFYLNALGNSQSKLQTHQILSSSNE